MENITANDFRRQVGEYLNRTYYAKEQFVITKSGKQIAALVPISILERLAQLEELTQYGIAGVEAQGNTGHTSE